MANTAHYYSNYSRIQTALIRAGITTRSQLNIFDKRNGYEGISGIGPKLSNILENARKWTCERWIDEFPQIICDWEPPAQEPGPIEG